MGKTARKGVISHDSSRKSDVISMTVNGQNSGPFVIT